jgi:hypothetical protein
VPLLVSDGQEWFMKELWKEFVAFIMTGNVLMLRREIADALVTRA